jgi:hypothetical protein
MYPFEFWAESTQRVEFHWANWSNYRQQLFYGYPVQNGVPRVEFALFCPRDHLHEVPVHDWNPHHEIGNYHLTPHDCFYESTNWSLIFEAYPAHITSGWDGRRTPSYRMFVEEGHEQPWGDVVELRSTSSNIWDDSCFRYARFRDKWWKVSGFLRHWPPFTFNFPEFDGPLFVDFTHFVPYYPWDSRFRRDPEEVNWIEDGF